jgi:hypothetical protein
MKALVRQLLKYKLKDENESSSTRLQWKI